MLLRIFNLIFSAIIFMTIMIFIHLTKFSIIFNLWNWCHLLEKRLLKLYVLLGIKINLCNSICKNIVDNMFYFFFIPTISHLYARLKLFHSAIFLQNSEKLVVKFLQFQQIPFLIIWNTLKNQDLKEVLDR